MPNKKSNCFLPLIALPDEDQKRPEVVFNMCQGVFSLLWFYAVGDNGELKLRCFDPKSKDKNEFYSFKDATNKHNKANGIRSFKIQINEGVGRFTIVNLPMHPAFEGYDSFQEIADIFNSIEFGIDLKFDIESVEYICRETDGQSYRRIKSNNR